MKTLENASKRENFIKLKIGELLVKHTQLTPAQLQEALEIQKTSQLLLGEILLEKNYINIHDILKVICQQINLPYIKEIIVDDIDQRITNNIPINYAKKNEVLPLVETNHSVIIAISDPFNTQVIDDLQKIFNKKIELVVADSVRITYAINRVYEKINRNLVDTIEDEFEEDLDLENTIDILDAGADEAPVIRFVNSIIFRAVKENASDIHIEPYEKEVSYRFRINGIMSEILQQPLKTQSAVSSRIKVMAQLDIAEKRLPQDGRIKIKMAGKDIDIRLSTVPIQNGERIVMRVLEKSDQILSLEHLGYHGKVLKELDDLCNRKHGVIYVSGPTGSGKTTTLFAMLKRINSPDKMIITVEDPVEYEIHGISQIQVNPKIELNFAKALRSIVRQDPDVIMVGETRDGETASMAIEASLTGHFVLSTIHTNDSASAPNRLIDMGVPPFLIASTLIGILAQRLLQTLCVNCKEPDMISRKEIEKISGEKISNDIIIYKAKGCHSCNFRGYIGRTTVCELLMITDEVRTLILAKADSTTIKKMAISQGMISLRQDAIEKVYQGVTSFEEIMRAINDDDQHEI